MINPQIPLMAQGVTMPDPMAALARVAGLKAQQQSAQANELELQQRRTELAEQETLKAAFAETGGDLDKLAQAVAGKVQPKTLIAIQDAAIKRKTALAAMSEQERKAATAKIQRIGADLGSLLAIPDETKRAEEYTRLRAARIVAKDMTPEDAPEQYPGEDFLRMAQRLGQTAAQQIQSTFTEKADARAAEKHKAELPGVTADSRRKVLTEAAGTLSAATTAADYTRAYDALPEDQRTAFPDPRTFDPKKTPGQVRAVGMTPEQQTTTEQGAARLRLEGQRVALEGQRVKRGDRALEVRAVQVQQWKDGQLAALEKRHAAPLLGEGGLPVIDEKTKRPIPAMTPEEYEARKQEIEASYQQQMSTLAAAGYEAAPAPDKAPAPAKGSKVTFQGKSYTIGDPYTYQGQKYRLKGLDGKGNAILEEWRD